jgi:glycine dehydrogenase
MATREPLVRMMPGRIIGVSKDAAGNPAYRMALQTREQHIRRDKATSNICTAQALLANMAAFYAVYHGPEGLLRIALRTHAMARLLVKAVPSAPLHPHYFDTIAFDAAGQLAQVLERAAVKRINLRQLGGERVAVAFDETVGLADVADVVFALTGRQPAAEELSRAAAAMPVETDVLPDSLRRRDAVLSHPVFNRYHSETAFMRYLKKLENRDISLVHSMIPLGSCTMKLNAASEMAPVSWPEFAAIHPFVPAAQAVGYTTMLGQLATWLADITGFAAVSFQPNSGAQGEYAGLLAIRNHLAAKGEGHRDICLIPASAHGTNPASAQMMGMKIVVVGCDPQGQHRHPGFGGEGGFAPRPAGGPDGHLSVDPRRLRIGHPGCLQARSRSGGQVYMDGANMNAQAGLTKPGDIGADVCHLNLHKTFCIPHGGGGPAWDRSPWRRIWHPTSQATRSMTGRFPGSGDLGSVSAAPFGSALITTISWMYIRMMGSSGIRKATEVAILNANYIARRLNDHYQVLFTGANGRVAHECILDLRDFKARYGISAEDVAKRLMDYGFHAPTLSFPVADTLMVEPTESRARPNSIASATR